LIDIPEPVKRQVRQQAGFGCCKCGLPIIEYHHIVKNSENPEDIMLLCPLHHHEATSSAMLVEEQRHFKANPYNIKKGYVEGQLKINQKVPVITLGNNQFVGDGNFIVIDGENLLSIEINDNKLELSMKLYDRNDKLVAEVNHNEWVSGDPLPWDLESRFQWIRIKRKLRDIQLEIDATKYPIDIRADMWRKGQNFQLNPNILMFNGVVKESGLRDLALVALRLNVDTSKQTFSIEPDPRFGKGNLVSNAILVERVKEALRAWELLTCTHEYITIIDRKKYSVVKCRKCGNMEKKWK
jgi:hypothetical protein